MNEKIKELYVGQEFANYRRLCEFLGEKEKGGKSRDLQIKNWQRYFSFEKRGHKLIIIEIFKKSSIFKYFPIYFILDF